MNFPFEFDDRIDGQIIASYSGHAVIEADRTNGDPDAWQVTWLMLDALAPLKRYSGSKQPQCWQRTTVPVPVGHPLHIKLTQWVADHDHEITAKWMVHAENARRERVEA